MFSKCDIFSHYRHYQKPSILKVKIVEEWILARKNRWPKIWKWVCGPGNTTVKTTTPYAWACAWKNSCWMAPAAARAPPVRLLHCRMPFSCWETYPCVGWSRLVVVQLRKRRARPWQQARLKLHRPQLIQFNSDIRKICGFQHYLLEELSKNDDCGVIWFDIISIIKTEM